MRCHFNKILSFILKVLSEGVIFISFAPFILMAWIFQSKE